MRCDYCHAEQAERSNCINCGAPLSKRETEVSPIEKSEPFFYNGFICYVIRDRSNDTVEVQFWLGLQLVERFKFTRSFLEGLVPFGCDPMPFIWDLFLLAQKETNVLEYQDRNSKPPAEFVIIRRESYRPDFSSMSKLEILEAIRG